MNKPAIDPSLLGKHRVTLDTWNLIGKRIFTVKSEAADLEYNDQVKNGDPTRTVEPIRKYFLESVDITSCQVKVLPDNATLVIELNGDANLQFRLKPAKFEEVTIEKIKECIEANANTPSVTGREPIFFRDSEKLTAQIKKLNAFEQEKADKIAEKMIAIADFLKTLNKELTNSNDRYYEELGLKN